MFNFVKIILATNFTDIFSSVFSNYNNFNNITNLDINKNINSNIEYYSVNDNLKKLNNINNVNSVKNLNNLSNNIVDISNNVTDTLVKIVNTNLSDINSNLSNFGFNYSIVKSTVNSNNDLEGSSTNSNILTGFIVGMVICIFACAFIRLCSPNICFICLKNSLKCIIYIPRKLCSLCYSNKVADEESKNEYDIIN